MFRLRVEDSFASAHQLRGYRGKCENLHGHNWRVLVKVAGENLDELGMLMDFGDLKAIVRRALEKLDHRFLNEVPPFDLLNPTSENLAQRLFAAIGGELPGGVKMDEVTVWESDCCAASYSAETHGPEAGRPGENLV